MNISKQTIVTISIAFTVACFFWNLFLKYDEAIDRISALENSRSHLVRIHELEIFGLRLKCDNHEKHLEVPDVAELIDSERKFSNKP